MFSVKQNVVKGVKSNKKYHNLRAQDSSNQLLYMLLVIAIFETVDNNMIDSQKYDLLRNVFKPDQYFSFPVTEQNFVFSCTNLFP